MRKGFYIAAFAAVLVQPGAAAAGGNVYAPYEACISNCRTEDSNCRVRVVPNDFEREGIAECNGRKAACIQQCQYLSMPPDDGGAPSAAAQENPPSEAAPPQPAAQAEEAPPAEAPAPQGEEPAPTDVVEPSEQAQ